MLTQHREYSFALRKYPEILLFTVMLLMLGLIFKYCTALWLLLNPGLLRGIGSGQLQGNFILVGNDIAALRAGTELPGK